MYNIIDEPLPGKFERFVVNPLWPLFALMFIGSWLAMPWFVFNAFALGCHQKKKTIVYAILSFVGSAFLGFLLLFVAGTGIIVKASIPYAVILLTVWKLGMAYLLYTVQSPSFQLFEYFQQESKNGFIVLIIGFLIGNRLFSELNQNIFWFLIMR